MYMQTHTHANYCIIMLICISIYSQHKGLMFSIHSLITKEVHLLYGSGHIAPPPVLKLEYWHHTFVWGVVMYVQ